MRFAIGIRYLCGWAMATHPTDRESAEWPPHPDRLFMALAAAYFETDGSAEERAALEWLEGLREPRTIIASFGADDVKTRTAVTVFVPVNDTEMGKDGLRLLPEFRSRQARQFPVTIPADDTVHLVWDVDDTNVDPQLDALARLCQRVTYLGHSASLVQAWIERDFVVATPASEEPTQSSVSPRRQLVATSGRADRRVRISGPGRLADLEARFNREAVARFHLLQSSMTVAKGKPKAQLKQQLGDEFGGVPPVVRRPQPGLWQGYACVTEEKQERAAMPTVFGSELIVLRCVHDGEHVSQPLGLESTLQITEALRNAVMKHCCVQPPPEWVSGHKSEGPRSEDPHLAFVPLPHVGRQHADGHLLGIAIVVPSAVSDAEQRRCLEQVLFDEQALPRTLELRMPHAGTWHVELDERDDRPVALRPETWTAAAPAKPATPPYLWGTVTPIVFDRHPKTKIPSRQSAPLSERARAHAAYADEIEEMVRVACERIKLPRPTRVWVEPTSRFIGVPHARNFPMMQRKAGGNLHHTHAVIEFAEPVVGPVLLGAGRYRGYGLCRPIPARQRTGESQEIGHE